jgi:hypothetical protein
MLLMSPGILMVSMWYLNNSTVSWLRNSGGSKFQVTMVLGRNEYLYASTHRARSRSIMLYRILNNLVEVSLHQYIQINTTRTRGSCALNIRQISTRVDAYKYSFLPRTIVTCELFYECWNSSAWWVNSRKSPEYVQLKCLYLQLKAVKSSWSCSHVADEKGLLQKFKSN